MPDVNITVYVQAAEVIEAYEEQWKAEAQLEVLKQQEHMLVALIASVEEDINFNNHWMNSRDSVQYSKGARSVQEEISIKLRHTREEIKRVSNLSQGRDSLENNLMSSVAQLIQFNKEA